MSRERVIRMVRSLLRPEIFGERMSAEMRQAWDDDILQARAQLAMDATAEEGLGMTLDEALAQVAEFDQNDIMKSDERTGSVNPIPPKDAN